LEKKMEIQDIQDLLDKETIVDKTAAILKARYEADQAEYQRKVKRRNALKSTGPRTPEGKAASSKNRLAHGLCSSELLLPGELQSDFDLLRQEVLEAYQPATAEERILTDQLVEATWRLNRARRVETRTYILVNKDAFGILEDEHGPVDDHPDYLKALSMLVDDNDAVFRRLHRYVTTIERSYQRAHKMLREAIKRRPAVVPVAVSVPEPAPEPVVKVKAAAAGCPLPKTSFEPQFVPMPPAQAPEFHNRP
jgi:hypothetical protein